MFIGSVQFDNAYLAGGLALNPSDYALQAIDLVQPISCSGGLIAVWDQVNSKLQLFYPTGSTIAAPAAVGDPIVAAGGIAVTGVAADGRFTAGRAKELAAATDASAIVVQLAVFGH